MILRHIFLTGEKQVGKSTIWRTLLAGKTYAGFETRPFSIDGVKRGYIFHSLTPLPPGENDCPCVLRIGEKRHIAVLPVFEGAGIASLTQALTAPEPFILMDEIGKAEHDAAAFAEAVLRCLDDPRHRVFGVLQRGDAPLQRAIRERPDVWLIEVTPENRDAVLDELQAAAFL